MLKTASAIVLAALLAAAPASAGEGSGPAIDTSGAWIRATPPGAQVAAGYIVVTNRGPGADRLLAASAEFSRKAELHEVAMDGGVMRMRPVAGGAAIAAGESLVLEPGGMHLMFTGIDRAAAQGDIIPVVLEFEKAGRIGVDFEVRRR